MNREVHCFPEYHRAIDRDKRIKVINMGETQQASGSTKCLVRACSLLAASHTSVFTHTLSSLPSGAARVADLLTSGLPPPTLQQTRKCLPWGTLSQDDSKVQLGQSTHFSNPTREGQARQGPLEPTVRIPCYHTLLPLGGYFHTIFTHREAEAYPRSLS